MSRITVFSKLKICKSESNPNVLPRRVDALIYDSGSIALCQCDNKYLITSISKILDINVNTNYETEFVFDNLEVYGGTYMVEYRVHMSDGSRISKYSNPIEVVNSSTPPVTIYC